MDYKTLHLAHDSRIATITLNRPDKRNAINYELIEDLLAALNEVANSSALVLILTGAGKAFCSGMDLDNLKALAGRSPEQRLKDSESVACLFRSLYDLPRPTIAAVNGAAVAGAAGSLHYATSRWRYRKLSSGTPKCELDSYRRSFQRFCCGKSAKNMLATCC